MTGGDVVVRASLSTSIFYLCPSRPVSSSPDSILGRVPWKTVEDH